MEAEDDGYDDDRDMEMWLEYCFVTRAMVPCDPPGAYPPVLSLRPIPGHSDYAATAAGKIWSVRSQHYLVPRLTRGGYHHVYVKRDGERRGKSVGVHRLVAAAMLGLDVDESGTHVDHVDGIRSHNHVLNLRLCVNRTNVRWGMEKREGAGVRPVGMYWRASITVDGKWVNLGRYATKELAVRARQNAMGQLW
jgi:HNH endonuclease